MDGPALRAVEAARLFARFRWVKEMGGSVLRAAGKAHVRSTGFGGRRETDGFVLRAVEAAHVPSTGFAPKADFLQMHVLTAIRGCDRIIPFLFR